MVGGSGYNVIRQCNHLPDSIGDEPHPIVATKFDINITYARLGPSITSIEFKGGGPPT